MRQYGVFYGNCVHIDINIAVLAEEVAYVVYIYVFKFVKVFAFFVGNHAVAPVKVIENFFCGDGGGIADIIHIAHGDVGAGEEVDERLCRNLPVFVAVYAVFEHNPAVKPQVGAFFGHRIPQLGVLFVSLVHNVNGIARPLVVCYDLSRNHIRLAAVCFKGVNIVLYVLQNILCGGNRVGVGVV